VRILLVMAGRGQIRFEGRRIKAILPPSPLLEVAGLTSKKHHTVRIWDELAQGPVPNEMLSWANLVGISALTTSRLGAYRVASAARKLKKPVVAGGMDVTGHYLEGHGDELLAHYDAIVVGRLTSRLWSEVLSDFENQHPKSVYTAESLDDEPWEFVVPRYDLVEPNNYYFPAAVRTSAGCSYGCKWCTVGLICNKVEVKPHDILKVELASLPKTRMPLIVYDDCFGGDYDYTKEVPLPLLHSSGRRWFTELTTRLMMGHKSGNPALLEPMVDAGLMGAYLGIENVIEQTGGKSPVDLTEEAIRAAHRFGVIVAGSLMLDATGKETPESISQMVDWVLSNHLDLVQLSLVAALPGSVLRREALKLNLLIAQNPELFDGAWPTIAHSILSPEEQIELLRKAYYRIYSLTAIARRIIGHRHFWVNLLANLVVRRMSHRWWGQVGYTHWLNTRNQQN